MISAACFEQDECDVAIVQPELGKQVVPEALEKKLLSEQQELDVLIKTIFVERCRHGIVSLTHVYYAQ
jgi:hypothetical protein